jgi:hypothetical protein
MNWKVAATEFVDRVIEGLRKAGLLKQRRR